MAHPNRPVDRLVIARTASNGANVGPEVIRIRFPAKISRSLPVVMDLSNNKICEGRLRLKHRADYSINLLFTLLSLWEKITPYSRYERARVREYSQIQT